MGKQYDLSVEDECKQAFELMQKYEDRGYTVDITRKIQAQKPSQRKYWHVLIGLFAVEYGARKDWAKRFIKLQTGFAELTTCPITGQKTYQYAQTRGFNVRMYANLIDNTLQYFESIGFDYITMNQWRGNERKYNNIIEDHEEELEKKELKILEEKMMGLEGERNDEANL
jgi:hypothetical protein